jgi:predicted DNA-binding ribbon-helix-helix protein
MPVDATGLKKRSLTVAGHRTSVSLEEPFWDALGQLAKAGGVSVQALVAEIDRDRRENNLSSAIRVHVLKRFMETAGAGQPE